MTTPVTAEALYCRMTGRRLSPDRGRVAGAGALIAVLVFDEGTSAPIFGDTIVGRAPHDDHRVRAEAAEALTIVDPRHEISRCHLLLRVRGHRLEAVDLGSRNGTALARSGRWTLTMPGIGEPIADREQVRLGLRTLTVHYLQR